MIANDLDYETNENDNDDWTKIMTKIISQLKMTKISQIKKPVNFTDETNVVFL